MYSVGQRHHENVCHACETDLNVPVVSLIVSLKIFVGYLCTCMFIFVKFQR